MEKLVVLKILKLNMWILESALDDFIDRLIAEKLLREL